MSLKIGKVDKIYSSRLFLVLVIIFALPSLFFLFKKGNYEPHDLHHIADVYEMYRAFSSGQFPPRLGPDFSFGFGYPLFNYYYLLPFYVGAFFVFLTKSLILSYKLTFILPMFLSVFAMFVFLRRVFGNLPALVGALIYTYTPYRAVQLYVRGAVGEVWIMALLPLVAWSFLKVLSKPSLGNVASSSILLFLFLISHNYLSFLSLPLVLILVLFLSDKVNIERALKSFALLFVLALGASIYWWAPAILEKKLVSSQTPFPLYDHFPFLRQLIFPSWGYGASLWGSGDGMSFQIGVVNLLVLFSLLLLLTFKIGLFVRRFLRLSVFLVLTFFVLVFFMNVRSYPLWRLIPFYDFIQFPWRLLIYTTFVSSLMSAVLVRVLPDRWKNVSAFVIIVLSFVLTVGYFKPEKLVYKKDDDYLARFFADRTMQGRRDSISPEYLGYSEDYLLLPKWVSERAKTKPKEKIEVTNGILSYSEINPVHYVATVTVEKQGLVVFHSYYFPGWEVKLNGKTVPALVNQPYGDIKVEVPQGKSKIEFYWKETKLRLIFDLISVASLLALLYILFNGKLNKRKL